MVEMVKPDERAVMTYVSCFYHAFQGQNQVSQFTQKLILVPSKSVFCQIFLYNYARIPYFSVLEMAC